ncbi:MlaD family protein [Cellvibrio japonicus]|uniref:Conserved domain protein n=1 Tax=Cellvibrio japonicus (strain Ueda107) TaxID=498211 RepID=B3PE98_CELJU|nr:MlaD family protein [Cellvibrio japonicus]ACE82864.1 conserved domain protein [Cellvibrio japonicus Ueda107]QEI12138.1 MCE family protein [Cellvibrio japonicus]QEI15712.1 MCE family protein [Cellvibrio japonicus]QEI19290.1 MCE family protein [Cellvibrio japonicus]
MSKTKSLHIGSFVTGAFILVFIALLFFSGGKLFSQKERVVMYFDGSVQGLQVGAPVKLKGVVLGDIVDIQLNIQNDNQPLVTAVTADLIMKRITSKGADVSEDFFHEAIKQGLRAQLNYQSFLTGLLYVELDFFPNTPVRLYKLQNDLFELPTVATDFEEISKNLQEINIKSLVDNLDQVAQQLNSIARSGVIQDTLLSFDKAAKSMDKTANNLDREMAQLNKQLDITTRELNRLLRTLNEQTPILAQNLNQNLLSLQQSLDQFTRVAQTLEHTLSEDAPLVNQLNTTLQDVSDSARAFRNLSDTLEQQPEAIWRGKNSAKDVQ